MKTNFLITDQGEILMSAAILIVDDDKENQELLVQVLGEEGYRVHSAAAGQKVLEVLEENKFDLVILELKLPDMNGVQHFSPLRGG